VGKFEVRLHPVTRDDRILSADIGLGCSPEGVLSMHKFTISIVAASLGVALVISAIAP
jgi:hypothetical protein